MRGRIEAFPYVHGPFAYQSFRPALHVKTAIPLMLALEHYPQGSPFDFEQSQRGYLHSFPNSMPGESFRCITFTPAYLV
jgi:hypothetical protein